MKFILSILGVSTQITEAHLRSRSAKKFSGATDDDYIYGLEQTSDPKDSLDFAVWENDNTNDNGDGLDNGSPFPEEEMNQEDNDPARPIVSEEDDDAFLQKPTSPTGATTEKKAAPATPKKVNAIPSTTPSPSTSDSDNDYEEDGDVNSNDFEADVNAVNDTDLVNPDLVDAQGNPIGDDSADLVGSDVDSEDGHIVDTLPVLIEKQHLHHLLTDAEYIDEVRTLAFLQEHGADADDEDAFNDPSNYNIGQYFSEASRQEIESAQEEDDDPDMDPSRFEDEDQTSEEPASKPDADGNELMYEDNEPNTSEGLDMMDGSDDTKENFLQSATTDDSQEAGSSTSFVMKRSRNHINHTVEPSDTTDDGKNTVSTTAHF